MTIVIISLFLATYTIYSSVKERKVVQKRVETMNNFISSMEQDIPRKMFIAGFRSIFVFNNKIVETGLYVNNVSARLEEMFYNGTFLGEPQTIMNGAKFSDVQNDLSIQGNKINVDVSITNASIKIDQTDPWNVRVTLISNFSINDTNNLASWDKTLVSSGFIPIYHFEDPFYLLNTGGIISNKINQTPYQTFDSQTLLNHTQMQYYINTTDAPSFIDRLEGKTSSSTYGIESLVYIPDLSNAGLPIYQRSIVDYIYFSQLNNASCHVSGQPSWFYLDSARLARYGAACG